MASAAHTISKMHSFSFIHSSSAGRYCGGRYGSHPFETVFPGKADPIGRRRVALLLNCFEVKLLRRCSMGKPLSRMAGATLVVLLAAEVGAQAPTSTQLAKQLVTTLAGVDAIAARDPQDPTRAIAALVFPESQLLVVSASYPDTAGLDAFLTHRMYRDVYSVLQQPSMATGKVFFQDMGCDGFQPGSVDVMYEDGKQTIF